MGRPGNGGLLALAALLGCGGGGSNDPGTAHAGSRLKPIVYDVGGAETNLDEWMDTALGTECMFQYAEDGSLRCLPTMTFPLVSILFQDPACSNPVGSTDPTCATRPHFAIQSVPVNSCTQGTKIFRVTGPVASPTNLFLRDADGTCTPNGVADPTTASVFALEAMLPTDFVGATTKTRARAPGMSAQVREADDGSWEITGFFDEAAGHSCWPADLKDSPKLVCLPSSTYVGSPDTGALFVDSTCQTLAAESYTCAPPALIGLQPPTPTDANACAEPYASTVYALEDGPATLYSGTAAACSVLQEEDGFRHYRVGARLEPASFPAMELLQLGSGRLHTSFLGSGGVPYVAKYPSPVRENYFDYFLDSKTNEGCPAWLFADGKYRCAPRSWVGLPSDVVPMHEAADCTGPMLVPPPLGCTPRAPSGALFINTSLCAAWFTVAEARAAEPTPLSLTTIFIGTPGACEPSDLGTPMTFYRLGEPVNPADVFAEIKRGPRD